MLFSAERHLKTGATKKYMKNDAAAEDVLQDAYIKIWVNLPGLDKPENFNLEDYSQDLMALIEHFNLNDPIIIGFSLSNLENFFLIPSK